MQDLRKALEHQRKELNDCRAEITALKMHIEGSCSSQNLVAPDVVVQSQSLEKYKEEIKALRMEIERLKAKNTNAPDSVGSVYSESTQTEEKVVEVDENKSVTSYPISMVEVLNSEEVQSLATQILDHSTIKQPEEASQEALTNLSNANNDLANSESILKQNDEPTPEDSVLNSKSGCLSDEADKTASSFSIFRIAYPFTLEFYLLSLFSKEFMLQCL